MRRDKSGRLTKGYRINALASPLNTLDYMPYFSRERSSRVVKAHSISSQTGFADENIYGGSKAAIESYTRSNVRHLSECAIFHAINVGGPVENVI